MAKLRIEVVYALREAQDVTTVELPEGATLRAAIEASAVMRRHPEIDLGRNRIGIFGKQSRLDAQLRAGDRVEIYRPLAADPKQARRERARRRR